MSKFECLLVDIELTPHPDADSLSLVKVNDFQCVCKTSEFINETKAVYVPIDSYADKDNIFLDFLEGKKVKVCKLRGAISEGVLIPESKIKDYCINQLGMQDITIEKMFVTGRNFAGLLGIKKWYEYKLGKGLCEKKDIEFEKYTDIENFKKYGKVFEYGDEVYISEKLHGTSARYGLLNGEKIVLGSRGRQLQLQSKEDVNSSVWSQVYHRDNIEFLLKQLYELYKENVFIYGEIVGPGIQGKAFDYSQDFPTLFVYDIKIGNSYLDAGKFLDIVNDLKIKSVPVLKYGKFCKEDLELLTSKSILDGKTIREGIVIKPTIEKYTKFGRLVLKLISDEYNLKTKKDILHL